MAKAKRERRKRWSASRTRTEFTEQISLTCTPVMRADLEASALAQGVTLTEAVRRMVRAGLDAREKGGEDA